MSGIRHHTTQTNPAYEPAGSGVRLAWVLVVAALVLAAFASLALRPVCRPDVAGATEAGFGIAHERRDTTWYHCEPWIRHTLAD